MPKLNLKPTHKAIRDYYESLEELDRVGAVHEGAVRSAFKDLLSWCGRKLNMTLVQEYSIFLPQNRRIVVDGALVPQHNLVHGYWEAKDISDDLQAEVNRKFKAGYPKDNILFQTPVRAILWQEGSLVLDVSLTDKLQLIKVLQTFFAHVPQEIAKWEEAVAQFKDVVPDIGRGLSKLIHEQRRSNCLFEIKFKEFLEKCRLSINPNISEAAVEEMLIQHLLTERIFRTVFNNPDFTNRNAIAKEIEEVITALTGKAFNRKDFLKGLDRFYLAIERTAETISDYSQKQQFLNTVYEQFFQGFSLMVADTHGIVYTPQPIVDFMVGSVEHILKTEFDRSLSDGGVHIIDPFVGTGNFIVRMMREIPRTELESKYARDLHCNEVMLLPYYIACMNIEHEFYESTGQYRPFEGLCLVDTFELAEGHQTDLFTAENTARVERQKEADMFVVVGNPPYNMGQVNDSDNNRNRKYEKMDKRVGDTYARDSNATLKTKLSDPYVKAIRWASDRIGEQGIVALVTNSAFMDGVAFDGMRKHLAADFDRIYVLDLSGNVRKNPRLSGTTHNVFGIQVGVSINFLIKTCDKTTTQADIFYARVGEFWRKEDKYRYLDSKRHYQDIRWKRIAPDSRHTWLTEGLHPEFDGFIPIGTKDAKTATSDPKGVIFKAYSTGVMTARDAWVYDFQKTKLARKVFKMIDFYNDQVSKWQRSPSPKADVIDFVVYEDSKIKWDRQLRQHLSRGRFTEYSEENVRDSLYRPFTKSNLYFDRVVNNCVYVFPSIFPIPETHDENRVICVSGLGSNKPFQTLIAAMIPGHDTLEKTQCFPCYTYEKDGSNRQENITNWAYRRFCDYYRDDTITKWSIFHYVYGLLHHPDYRERYLANLKRDLPRIPHAPDFWAFANAGARLAEIHVSYEDQPEYPLTRIETPNVPLDWRVVKMKLSKDKTQIKYNDFLTLDGIPEKAFDYRLGNRSALEWVIDQYRVKTDKRSGIENDPNRPEDESYIVRRIGQVITVSLETVDIVEGLPELGSLGK